MIRPRMFYSGPGGSNLASCSREPRPMLSFGKSWTQGVDYHIPKFNTWASRLRHKRHATIMPVLSGAETALCQQGSPSASAI